MFRVSLCFGLALLLAGLPGSTFAFLGGFEEGDGYHTPVTVPGYLDISGLGMIPSLGIAGDATFYLNNNPLDGFISWVPASAFPTTANDTTHGPDVTRYNAGEFGVNNGGPGGVGIDIADGAGLWTVLAGGRLNEDSAAPFYNGTAFEGRDHIIAWRYPFPHSGFQVLDLLATQVDLSYDYSFDSRDFNGVAPANTGSHQVTMSFWFCPTDSDDGYADNVFGLGILDSGGQTLLEFGYNGDNFLQYRVGGSSLWQTTAVSVGAFGWSNALITIDTLTNAASFSASAWSDGSASLGPQTDFFVGLPLGVDAGSLKTLRWSAEGGVLDAGSGAVAHKNTFDDFEFNVAPVPEPGSAWLIALAGVFWMRRARR